MTQARIAPLEPPYPEPVQADCPCLLCRRFSRAYIAHLFRAKELLAYRLATCHNLTFTLDFMVRIRAAIRAAIRARMDADAMSVHASFCILTLWSSNRTLSSP